MRFKKLMHNLHGRLGSQEQALLVFMYSSIPLRWRKKKGFWKYLEFLRGSQWESPEWHKNYQELQLLALVKYASTSTTYYRELFNSYGIEVSEIRSLESLRQVPILQKQTLVQRLNEFQPDNFPNSRLMINGTSGSTGEPFKFQLDYYAVMREEAFAGRHWENAGMTFGQPSIYLRSYIPEIEGQTYYFDRVNNRHYLSAYHLDQKNFQLYCSRIEKSGTRFIFGYPSSLEIFSDFLMDAGKALNFTAAITGSEMLSPNVRRKIESALNTRVYDWYGLAEPAVTMGQCELGKYHVFSEYGILELLDAEGNPITREGEIGRIVGTNFTNRALPLIRYETNDLGVYTGQKCICGRGTPVLVSAIEGRKDDLLIGADGQFLPAVNFYSLFAKLAGEVKRFQLIQKEPLKFSLKLIRGPEFSDTSVNRIIEGLSRRIGGQPLINIETVEKITPTKAGKIRSVVREFSPAPLRQDDFNEN